MYFVFSLPVRQAACNVAVIRVVRLQILIMRYLFILLFGVAAGTGSCRKSASDTTIADGTYTGTFQRTNINASIISNVTLTFSENRWSGTSDHGEYPALCNGTYSTNGNTITFNNACAWLANFDWTYILAGSYTINTSGQHITITKDYNGVYQDIYKLSRQ